MRRVALLAILPLSAAQALGAPAPTVESYRLAANRHEVGGVDVRAFTERRAVGSPDLPLPGAAIVLMPFSDSFVTELERIKGQSRESLRTYRAAALELRRREEAYERAVWEAGAADLVLSALVGPDGRASFGEVAAGPWLLWGRHQVWNPVAGKRPKRQEKELFALAPRLVGFWAVRYWMIPVTVRAGAVSAVELTDRDVWFSGVIEETMRQDIVP